MFVVRLSVWTLADCKGRAAAPGLTPLRLPRAPIKKSDNSRRSLEVGNALKD